jgi:cellulase/cellobiase CelA1
VVQAHAGNGSPSSSPSTSPSRSVSPSPSVSPSRSVSPSASPSPSRSAVTGSCRVSYSKNEWQGGVVANLTVTNTGTAAVNGWTLGFSFPGDTTVTSAWSATVTQSGHAVTATNVSYNASIPAGGNVQFGFQGAWTSSDANPTSFTLNGAACTIG